MSNDALQMAIDAIKSYELGSAVKHPQIIERGKEAVKALRLYQQDGGWRPVKGWEDHYAVNANGQVKRISKTDRTDRKTDVLTPFLVSGKPYLAVRLSSPNCRKIEYIHRIVAGAFVDNPNNCNVVNHIDCDPSNNHYSNLEWCSQTQNVQHSKALGRYPDNYWQGKRSPNAKLSDEDVKNIRAEYSLGKISHERLAEKYGCSKRSIGRILTNKSYALPPAPKKENDDE